MDYREYITSERFIHDELVTRSKRAVARIPELWKKHKFIEPSLFLWPSEELHTKNGGTVRDLVICKLPDEREQHEAIIKDAIKKTRAYALLLVRNEGKSIRALLESPHGTRAWIYPIKRSADTRVLGNLQVINDRETLGLLWSPKQSRA